MRIRPARGDDRAFVLEQVPRLAAFPPTPTRPAAEIIGAESRVMREYFEHPPEGTALLIAESDDGERIGFLYLERHRDYFTLEDHGHVSMIVVAEHAAGRGVGQALMRAAEDWARSLGFRRLTLNVMETNARARAMYERLGFTPESLHYAKLLTGGDG